MIGEEGATPLPPEQTEERRPRRDVLSACLLLVLSAVFALRSFDIPFKDVSWEWYSSPTIFPLAMSILLAALSLLLLGRGIVSWIRQKDGMEPVRAAKSLAAWGIGRFLGGAALIALYLFFLGKVNFYIMAAAMITTLGVVFRNGPAGKAVKASLVASAVIIVFLAIIGKVFGIVFP